MNILIGKSGVSIKFRDKHDISLGDAFYFALCRQYPQHQFYLASCSNIDKIDDRYIPDNLHYIRRNKVFTESNAPQVIKHNMLQEVKNFGVKMDLAIIYDSYICNTCRNDANFVQTEVYAKPILYVIAALNIPWICLVDDATIFTGSIPVDMHAPMLFLSQCNAEYEKRTVKEIDKLIEKFNQGLLFKDVKNDLTVYKEKVPVKYASLEKFFLNKRNKVDFRNMPKTNEWLLAARLNPVRVKEYNKWFGEESPFKASVKIYTGQKCCKDAADLELESEHKLFHEMEDLIWDSRYAFISQNQLDYTGFVTQKFWDMVYHGIIPFFDKNMYDTDDLLHAPEICKVSNPQELYDRVQTLNNDESAYRKVLQELWDLLDDKYFDESYLREVFDEYLNKDGEEVKAAEAIGFEEATSEALF